MIRLLFTAFVERRGRLRARRFSRNRLAVLPDAALKDLGISRSEITSCAMLDSHRRRSRR